jgi:DHA1 family bicyclomycin/chloramphenicol resistance-like MFS transporter
VAIDLAFFVLGSVRAGGQRASAVGACTSVVPGRAMVRDLYEGARAAQMLSILMTVMAIAPLLGPIIGAQIFALAGWRTIFWVLVGVGLAMLCGLLTLPETLSPVAAITSRSRAR